MVPELEKPRITEIHVRMDCNGCVQKIKKALHGINGIYDLYIDFPQQKLTIIGWADPEKIVKAIKKTRKIATICSHIEQPTEPPPPAEQPPEGGTAPPPDAANPPPTESPPPAEPTPPPEAAPPAEPPKDPPPPEQPPPPEALPTPVAAETNLGQQHPIYHHRPREVGGEVHAVYHHPPPDYGYRYGYPNGYPGYYNRYHNSQGPPPEPTPPPAPVPAPAPTPGPAPVMHAPPVYVTHSYNTYRPSPYVTEYEYVPPSPQQQTHYYNRISQYHHYNEDQPYQPYQPYHNVSNGNGTGNITSIFSDENPNACAVM